MKSSALVLGDLTHIRYKPHRHQFSYGHVMTLIDLDDIKNKSLLPWPIKHNRFGIMSIRDQDHIKGSYGPIFTKLRCAAPDIFTDESDRYRVFMLTTPAVMGYAFNPATFYFIFDETDSMTAVVVEVRNTFGQVHLYELCIQSSDRVNEFQNVITTKKFHVSPFLGMDGVYEFHFNLTESSVNFGIILSQDDQKILDTTFQGYIIPLTTRNLLKCVHRVLTTVLMTEFRILRQAYSLFFKKRIRFFTNPHPRKIGSGTRSRGFISKLKLPFK